MISAYAIPGLKYELPKINKFNHSQVMQIVADYFYTELSEIASKQDANTVYKRDIMFYILREYSKLTMVNIAKEFKRADHTSIVKPVRKIKMILNDDDFPDKNYRIDIENILKLLY